jgi:RES domain-containing protein
MRVYRITTLALAHDCLAGIGAALYGGRWNSKGTRIGYTAASRSGAILEMLVHVGDRRTVPSNRVIVPIDVPDDAIDVLDTLPRGWDRLPYSTAVQRAGDTWARAGRALALRVPSAVVREESNVLINPLHARFVEIAIGKAEPLVLDERLFGE